MFAELIERLIAKFQKHWNHANAGIEIQEPITEPEPPKEVLIVADTNGYIFKGTPSYGYTAIPSSLTPFAWKKINSENPFVSTHDYTSPLGKWFNSDRKSRVKI